MTVPIGKRIASARVTAQMSQHTLAVRLRTHATTISKWERGILRPCPANTVRLSAALGVSQEWLATGRRP
jgi:transcriptional regulator with XRE-family HTH domain